VTLGFAVAAVSGLHAAPLERQLDDGLGYVRIHALPGDLPTEQKKQPLVLDLRFVKSDATTARVVLGWLKFRAAPATPLFVLVNSGTAAPMLAALQEHEPASGLFIIGSGMPGSEIDFRVSQPAADERRAYDALEAGSTVAELITDNPDKQRDDEASLANHDHPAEPLSSADEPEELAPEKKTRPPIDRALQRAVQLYHGVIAARKH
jgi:hypothetical protein